MPQPPPQSHPHAGSFKASTKPVELFVLNIAFPNFAPPAVLTIIKTMAIETKAILYDFF